MNSELTKDLRVGDKVYFFEYECKPVLRTGKVSTVCQGVPYFVISLGDDFKIFGTEKIFTDKESALASIEVKE